jgi:hypothetical protein
VVVCCLAQACAVPFPLVCCAAPPRFMQRPSPRLLQPGGRHSSRPSPPAAGEGEYASSWLPLSFLVPRCSFRGGWAAPASPAWPDELLAGAAGVATAAHCGGSPPSDAVGRWFRNRRMFCSRSAAVPSPEVASPASAGPCSASSASSTAAAAPARQPATSAHGYPTELVTLQKPLPGSQWLCLAATSMQPLRASPSVSAGMDQSRGAPSSC